MSAFVPMDVDPSQYSTTPTLKNTIPRHAPEDISDMTIQEEKEYHRRQGEDEYINSLQSKIDVLEMKLKRAQEYKDTEVQCLNKRRNVYDNKIKVKDDRKTIGSSIRKRQLDEADQKEKVLEYLKRRTKKQTKLEDIRIPSNY